MRVLIFGFGNHGGGFASAKYFLERGNEVRITDRNSISKLGDSIKYFQDRGVELVLGQHRESDFLWADVVVKSPAISQNHPYLLKAKKIINDFTCLFEFPDISQIKLITITGTKGKTTTAAAVTHVLNAIGFEAVPCGNMGISAFSILQDLQERKAMGARYPDYLVCELSSWQIADTYTYAEEVPEIEVSCMTSLYEDHQNYYHSMDAYIRDKLMLFKQNCRHIVSTDLMKKKLAEASGLSSTRIISIEKAARKTENGVLAPAYAICQALGLDLEKVSAALKTFPGVPHRNEMVRFHHNIIFINDSAATVPDAVQFTFNNFYARVPVFLICGGTDKELHSTSMEIALTHSRSLYLLNGSFTREKLIPRLTDLGVPYSGPFDTMDEAVAMAYADAKAFTDGSKGLTAFVILSPGAASFELFLHEFDRGNQFKKLVNALDD